MPRSSVIRTRAYRQRLARGGRVVALEVSADDVAALVRAGLLAASPDGHDLGDVARAIARLLGSLPRFVATTARPQAAAPPAPAVPVPAPPTQRFASVVVPGLGDQRRRG